MRTIINIVLFAGALTFVACNSTQTPSNMDMSSMHSMPMSTPQHDALAQAMRKLWAEHVVYTRLYIISAVDGSDDTQTVAGRLLKNQEDIGNAIAPYYGAAAGQKLTDLLKQHILIAVDLVTAAKANDQAKVQDADRRWHANAADIAAFLSGANPNWPRQAVLDMLNQHLALTTREATDRIQKNHTDELSTYDQIFGQAMMMADTLTNGIVAQFPTRFA